MNAKTDRVRSNMKSLSTKMCGISPTYTEIDLVLHIRKFIDRHLHYSWAHTTKSFWMQSTRWKVQIYVLYIISLQETSKIILSKIRRSLFSCVRNKFCTFYNMFSSIFPVYFYLSYIYIFFTWLEAIKRFCSLRYIHFNNVQKKITYISTW